MFWQLTKPPKLKLFTLQRGPSTSQTRAGEACKAWWPALPFSTPYSRERSIFGPAKNRLRRDHPGQMAIQYHYREEAYLLC